MAKQKISDIIKLFKNPQKYWYLIPRAQYFNEENLKEFYNVLSFFKKYQFIKASEQKNYHTDMFGILKPDDMVLNVWDQDMQMIVYKEMITKKIISPVKGKNNTDNDKLANFRNHINLCKKLGFAHINRLKHLYISDMGENFLHSKPKERNEILEQQLRKIQFFNPSLKVSEDDAEQQYYKEFKLFPYFYILRLLVSLPEKYLTVDEYIFVCFSFQIRYRCKRE